MRELLTEHFDKLLALIMFMICVSLLLGVVAFKATELYTLSQFLVSSAFSALITLLTGKAIVNLVSKTDPPKQ